MVLELLFSVNSNYKYCIYGRSWLSRSFQVCSNERRARICSQKITRLQNVGNFYFFVISTPVYSKWERIPVWSLLGGRASYVLDRSIKNSGTIPLSYVGHSVQLILDCRIASIFPRMSRFLPTASTHSSWYHVSHLRLLIQPPLCRKCTVLYSTSSHKCHKTSVHHCLHQSLGRRSWQWEIGAVSF
jgi:hypothetical protein